MAVFPPLSVGWADGPRKALSEPVTVAGLGVQGDRFVWEMGLDQPTETP